jgi:lipoprotein NlpD
MRIKVIEQTFFKLKPVQSSELGDRERYSVASGTEFDLHSYVDEGNNHLRIALLGAALNGRNTWYVFSRHVSLLDEDGKPIVTRRMNTGGVSPAGVSSTGGWQWPMRGTSCGSVCEFGYSRGRLHAGVDIGGYTPDEVYAASDGTVSVVKNDTSGAEGRAIYITRPDGWRHVYFHLASILVSPGQQVKRGQQIGVRGGSGFDSENGYAIHLHFEIRRPDGTPVNPRDTLPDDGSNPIVG